jgi:hypothetical protein
MELGFCTAGLLWKLQHDSDELRLIRLNCSAGSAIAQRLPAKRKPNLDRERDRGFF